MAEYIEREALLADIRDSYQKLHEIYNGLKFENERAICGAELTTFCEILMRIKDWPAADVVEVKRGRWIWNEECCCWVCSNCYLSALNNWRGLSTESNYCPNCGADMRGVNDE